MRRLFIVLFTIFVSAVAPAMAQEEPPARVGRVSFVEGNLAFHMPGETQWSAAAVNYPVASGGSFWTDPRTRAEFRIGAQTIDLAGGTEVDIAILNEQVTQFALPQGRINLHVRQLDQGNSVEIDLARGGLWLLQPGIYDIEAGNADQPTRIAVFEGSARFVGGTVDLGIKAGQVAVISGPAGALTATTEKVVPDAFAEWCRSRDYHEKRLAAPYYVSPQMTGYAELDEYGSWGEAAQYGRVWYPRDVPADWVPYHDGHWVWVEPWGWTWVDAMPWGFAPFHYGRWAHIGGRWGWIPGRFERHPVYAPALVAFIGEPGVGIRTTGARGPAVGWFPLGPNEVYWPSYTRNPTYIRRVNITNVSQTKIVNITNVTVNRQNAGPPPQVVHQTFANRNAATVVPVRVFAAAAPVAPAAEHVAPQKLREAPVSVRPPQVQPAAARIAPAHAAAPPITQAVRPPAAAPAHPPAATAHVPPPTSHVPPTTAHQPPQPAAVQVPPHEGHQPPNPAGAHVPPHELQPQPHPTAVHVPPPAAHQPPAAAHVPPPAAHQPPNPAAVHVPPHEVHQPPQPAAVHVPPHEVHQPPHPAPAHAPPPEAHQPPHPAAVHVLPHEVHQQPHPAPAHAPPPEMRQPPHPAAVHVPAHEVHQPPHPAPAHAAPPEVHQQPHPAAAAHAPPHEARQPPHPAGAQEKRKDEEHH